MRVLLLVALTGCVVVRPPKPTERPIWRVTEDKQLDVDCVSARPLVRKSGKQGIGIALQLKSRGDCDVRFTVAHLHFADGTRVGIDPPSPQALPGRSLVYVWWPVRFDNNAAWNAGRRSGDLELAYAINGATGTWRIAMVEQ